MLALTGWIAKGLGLGFEVNGFGAAFFGALVMLHCQCVADGAACATSLRDATSGLG